MKLVSKEGNPKEYRIWKAMRARCNAPCFSRSSYQIKGIKVCERWNLFDNFISDMGRCPEGYSIDRIDNDKDYCPENCRWASYKEQALNRGSFNDLYTCNNKTLSLKEWSRELRIGYTTLRNRIYRSGWSFEDAIAVKLMNKTFLWEGKYYSGSELAVKYNLPVNVFYGRICSQGWTLERTLSTPKLKNL